MTWRTLADALAEIRRLRALLREILERGDRGDVFSSALRGELASRIRAELGEGK